MHDRHGTSSGAPARFRLAADIGGTFTDLVLVSDAGAIYTRKILSTPPQFWRAVIDGLLALLRDFDIDPLQVVEICHATTVATNSVLERNGPRTGLITTKGFRDVLELRRMRFPDTYNLFWEKPVPLVEREFRLEVPERIGADGSIVVPLDRTEAMRVIDRLIVEKGVESIAIALINSPVNSCHEQEIASLIAQRHPGTFVCISSEVLPELREYERTSTAVLNAYLRPTLSLYLEKMVGELKSRGFHAPVYVMHSGGGIMSADAAIQFPVHVLESGPAAGIMGAAAIVGAATDAAVTFDMGGTTAKAALVEGGIPLKAQEFEIGAPISSVSRVLKGGGYLVRVPAIDVAEVGAGGGSIASIDTGGALTVGPASAGASPGPACYALGGTEPTVTDANLILGFLSDRGLMGGEMPLDRGRAEASFASIAKRAQRGLVEMAHGVRQVAVKSMARAVHAVSTERGRDVRKMTLVAFGGNGPLHAAALATTLGIRRVVVPPAAGVFSALGLLCSDNERTFVRPFLADLDTADATALAQAFEAVAHTALEAVKQDRPDGQVTLGWFADLRYKGQKFELRIALQAPADQSESQVREAFEQEYRRTYGHDQPGAKVQVVSVGCVARARVDRPSLGNVPAGGHGNGCVGHRDVYFSPQEGFVKALVYAGRDALGAQGAMGPLVIDEYDCTTVAPPGWRAHTDAGQIVLDWAGAE